MASAKSSSNETDLVQEKSPVSVRPDDVFFEVSNVVDFSKLTDNQSRLEEDGLIEPTKGGLREGCAPTADS